MDTKRIADYLRQFPEALGEEMLNVLDALLFLERDSLGAGLASFLETGASEDEIYVPLTIGPEKSAHHLPYFLADQRETRLNVLTLEEALELDGPITFFDDCNISGTQSCTAVQVWFGLEPDLPEEAPDLATELAPEQRAKLLGRRTRFRFAYAHKPGLGELSSLLSTVGLGDDVEAQNLEVRTTPAADLEISSELLAFLQEVGHDVLSSTKGADNPERWPEARCEGYALGYGGKQQLLVMFYNTPTGTLTALWKTGRFRGAPWLPLFPRRDEPGVVRPLGQ